MLAEFVEVEQHLQQNPAAVGEELVLVAVAVAVLQLVVAEEAAWAVVDPERLVLAAAVHPVAAVVAQLPCVALAFVPYQDTADQEGSAWRLDTDEPLLLPQRDSSYESYLAVHVWDQRAESRADLQAACASAVKRRPCWDQ